MNSINCRAFLDTYTITMLPFFRRAKVLSNGENYVSVVGRCSVCGSFFKGIVSEKPPENAR